MAFSQGQSKHAPDKAQWQWNQKIINLAKPCATFVQTPLQFSIPLQDKLNVLERLPFTCSRVSLCSPRERRNFFFFKGRIWTVEVSFGIVNILLYSFPCFPKYRDEFWTNFKTESKVLVSLWFQKTNQNVTSKFKDLKDSRIHAFYFYFFKTHLENKDLTEGLVSKIFSPGHCPKSKVFLGDGLPGMIATTWSPRQSCLRKCPWAPTRTIFWSGL